MTKFGTPIAHVFGEVHGDIWLEDQALAVTAFCLLCTAKS